MTQILLDSKQSVSIRIVSAQQLYKLKKTEAFGLFLITVLQKSPPLALKKTIFQLIGLLKAQLDKKLQGPLHELLYESEFLFYPKRAIIANLLGRIHSVESVPYLLQYLADKTENKFVRGATAEALGEIQDKRAIPLLFAIFQDESEPIRVRSACAMSLGLFSYPEAIEPFIQALSHPEAEFWMAVINALENYDPDLLVNSLFQLYLQFPYNHKLLPKIQELLLRGNLIPLLSQLTVDYYPIVQDLLLQQGNRFYQQLDFVRHSTSNITLQSMLDLVLNHLQSSLPLENGLKIIL